MPSNRSLANLHISGAMIMFYMHKLAVQEGGGSHLFRVDAQYRDPASYF